MKTRATASPTAGPVDVRATYLRFPRWSQPLWTWLTGRASPGQRPLVRHTWASYLAVTLGVFGGGLLLSAAAMSTRFAYWYLAVVAGVVATLAAARTMILVIAHQCIHRRFSGRPRLDRAIGELVTLLTVYYDAGTFRAEHFDAHHRAAVFATSADPPVRSLIALGFRPTTARRRLWRRAAVVVVSPQFYLTGCARRFWCNLTTGTWRRAAFLMWAGAWLSLPLWLSHGPEVVLVAFVIPLLPLAELSALLDRLGEHAWLTPRQPGYADRYYHVPATWARFCGAPVPAPGLTWASSLLAWLTWTVATLCYHLPCRLLVVVGDLPNHDFHHRHPGTWEWTVAAYARQRDIDRADPEAPAYSEVWGLGRAIDRMFASLEKAEPLENAGPLENVGALEPTGRWGALARLAR
ncbi:fatty acid desaturase [Parafrankia sp. FMc6]|uniref:fatty acid desaturase n=1 Tax=Parafrankia soli TaxID=2599596 RepID=UPI0034D6BB3B